MSGGEFGEGGEGRRSALAGEVAADEPDGDRRIVIDHRAVLLAVGGRQRRAGDHHPRRRDPDLDQVGSEVLGIHGGDGVRAAGVFGAVDVEGLGPAPLQECREAHPPLRPPFAGAVEIGQRVARPGDDRQLDRADLADGEQVGVDQIERTGRGGHEPRRLTEHQA